MIFSTCRIALAATLLVWSQPSDSENLRDDPQAPSGEKIFHEVCQACHMSRGEGASSPDVHVPALAKNQALAAAGYPVIVVLNGRGAMPWFDGVLTPAQIAAVVTYVRTHFGNNFPTPVTEQDVKQLAKAPPTAER